jgi:branched-chain amino acid transport system ATP-binding protein
MKRPREVEMTDEAAIEAIALEKSYGDVRVLAGVDLRVARGSVFALLGPNGAGKSTLLKVAAGLLPPTSGTVRAHGEDVTHLSEAKRAGRGLCLIPEGRGIFRQLTVRENLAMFAGGKKVAEAIDRAAAVFPILGERLGQEAGTMSGGQQQMLAVSRALVNQADVILADELSVGLAPVVIDEIFEAVDGFRREGRSLVVVEQYVGRVLGLADYVYILNKGQIAFVGEPEQCRDDAVFERYVGAAV